MLEIFIRSHNPSEVIKLQTKCVKNMKFLLLEIAKHLKCNFLSSNKTRNSEYSEKNNRKKLL